MHLNREPTSRSIDVPERESMDAVAAGRAYEDYVLPHSMVIEPATHTLSIDLSAAGYKKEHIRVQLIHSHGLVVVRGERPVAGNRWSRFRLQHRVPDGCDLKGIHAKFEGGVVRVTMPGLKYSSTDLPPAGRSLRRQRQVLKMAALSMRKPVITNMKKEKRKTKGRGNSRRRSAAVKDSGRGDKGDSIIRGEGAVGAPSRGGYRFLIPEWRKLATTVVGAVLVLFSLGLFVRYSLAP